MDQRLCNLVLPWLSLRVSLGKRYDLIKCNKQCLSDREIPQWSCPCDICKNVIFLANDIKKKLFPDCRLSVIVHELVTKFSCLDTENCMVW